MIQGATRRQVAIAAEDDVVAAGARYLDEAVVVDGNLITSRSPKDLPHFMTAIIDAFARDRAAV